MKNPSSDRWVAYLVAVTVGALVLLLGLQRFGIWQPHEVRVADMARELLSGQSVIFDRPPAQVRAVAFGFRLGGVTELAGRLPGALLAFAALASLMAAARGAGDRRLAVYTGIAYATLPLVFMNARQMFGAGIAQSAATLALSGSVLALWGRDRRWQIAGAVIGALGLALSVGAAGVLVGLIPMLGALGITVLLRYRFEHAAARVAGVASFAVALVLTALVSRFLRSHFEGYSFWVGATTAGAPATWQTFEGYFEQLAHGTFPWTGLVPFALVRLVSPPATLPEGDVDPMLDDDEAQEVDAWREGGMRTLAFVAIAVGFAAQTFQMQVFGIGAFVWVAPIALGLAALLRDCERERSPWRTVAVAASLFTLLMLRDYLQFPKSAYAALGLPDGGPAFPTGFAIKFSEWLGNVKAARAAGGDIPPMPAEGYYLIETGIFLVFGVLVLFQGAGEVRTVNWLRPYHWLVEREREGADALREPETRGVVAFVMANLRGVLGVAAILMMLVGVIFPERIPTLTTPGRQALHALAALPLAAIVATFALVAVWNAYAWVGRPGGPFTKVLGSRVAWIPLAAVVVAMVITQGYMPALSEHMSPRGVWAVVRALRHGDEPVGRFGGTSDDPATRYYTNVQPRVVGSERDAVDFLTGSQRSFLVIGSDVFPSLNQAYRRARHQNIPIADATNSNLLVGVSDLEGRPNRNPLDPWVMSERPRMRHAAREATRFESAFEYIGYDLDSNGQAYVPLGGSFKITFNFHVLQDSTRNWQIFIHTDGQGPRINGDHEACGGRYPTRYWQAGDFIRDQVTIQVPLTYRPGIYTVFMGLFDGGDRMRLEGGDHDRDNRVVVARINVR